VILIIALLISGIIFANLIKAQDIEDLQNMENPADVIKNKTGGIISEEGINTSEEAWQPYKSKAEERIEWINEKIGFLKPYLDPITNFVLKEEFAISKIFFLVLAIFILILIYILRLAELALPFSKWVSWVISIAFSLVLGITGSIKKIGEVIIKIVEIYQTWWVQLIIWAGIIVIIIIAIYLSKFLKKIKENQVQENKKFEEEQNLEKLKGNVEIAEIFTKGITEE